MQQSLNRYHESISQCKKEKEWKQRGLAAEESRAVTSRQFSAYIITPEMILSFKYLGRVLLDVDDDWPAVIQNQNVEDPCQGGGKAAGVQIFI